MLVCGTDFSEPSLSAGRVAAAIGSMANAPVVLAFVGSTAEEQTPSQDAVAGLQADAMRRLGATVEPRVVGGIPHEGLLRVADHENASLVVVGSNSRGAVERWWLGSVAEQTASSSKVPVLVVRGGEEPFASWARRERPLRVVVAVDPRHSPEALVDFIATLRGYGPCEVTAIHIASPIEEAVRLGVSSYGIDDVLQPEVESHLRQKIGALVARLTASGPVDISVIPRIRRVEQDLVRAASNLGADLLCVGTHQRRGLDRAMQGSVSVGALHNAPMSVACVPSPITPDSDRRCHRLRTVLVATDLTPGGNGAVPFAFGVAAENAKVFVLHVLFPGGDVAATERRLAELIPSDARDRGLTASIVVVESGMPNLTIAETAERLDVDAVCLATRGRGPLARAWLGDVAGDVTHRVPRPILLVPWAS